MNRRGFLGSLFAIPAIVGLWLNRGEEDYLPVGEEGYLPAEEWVASPTAVSVSEEYPPMRVTPDGYVIIDDAPRRVLDFQRTFVVHEFVMFVGYQYGDAGKRVLLARPYSLFPSDTFTLSVKREIPNELG